MPVLSFQTPLLISTKCSTPPALFGSPPATHQLEYEKGSPLVQTKVPSCATSVSPIQNGPVMMFLKVVQTHVFSASSPIATTLAAW